MNNTKISNIIKDNDDYKLQIDIILALLPMLTVSYFIYGFRPIIVTLVAIITAILCDYTYSVVSIQKRPKIDISSISSVMIMSCLLPASIPYNITIILTVFAIFIGKHVFGGQGSNIFNVPALGFCFGSLMFTGNMFKYPEPMVDLDITGNVFNDILYSPSLILKENGIPFVSLDDLFLGNYRGPLGTTFIFVLVSSCLFLLLRKRITWHIPVSFLSIITILFFIFPRIITGRLDSVIYEVFSQPMIFIALFIVTDKNTTPVKNESKILYGVSLGILSIFFENVSPFSMATLYAVLIMNALSPYFDRVLTPYVINFDYHTAMSVFIKFYIQNIVTKIDKIKNINQVSGKSRGEEKGVDSLEEPNDTNTESETTDIYKDENINTGQDRNLINDKGTNIVNDKNTRALNDKSRSVATGKSKGIVKDKSTKAVKDKSKTTVNNKTTNIVNDKNTKIIKDKSQSIVKDKNTKGSKDKNKKQKDEY